MTSAPPPEDSEATAPDPWLPLLQRVAKDLGTRLSEAGVPADPARLSEQIELAPSGGADLAWAAHRLARAGGLAPEALAERVAAAFAPSEELAEVRALRGFVNFSVTPRWLAETTLSRALDPAGRFGRWPATGRAVCVEHTSANPTGPFHMGRVRNGIIGDTMARVLRAAGESVTTQYYVDDVGRQSAMITWIWSKAPSDWPPEVRPEGPIPETPPVGSERPDLELGRPYPLVSAYLKTHPEAAAEVGELSRRLEAGDSPPRHHALAEAILGGMQRSLARIGIRFDEYVWESSFLHDGSLEAVVARLRGAPHAEREENGALAIRAESYGLPKEDPKIVILRGDGSSLYIARDLAYHLQKFGRFLRVIDVLGQDHRLHARSLEALLEEIGEARRPEFLIYQDITVPEGGRMSTRKGSAVWLDELLDEAVVRARAELRSRRPELPEPEADRISGAVAAGAIRYHILRVAPEKAVSFRWEDALSFEGRSGPFVQYAYARASAILRKGEAEAGPWSYRPEALADPACVALLRVLSRFPRTVAYAARTGHVHALAGYAHDLAEEFNRFYERVPVLAGGEERASRLALVAAVRQGLRGALDLVGVEPLEAM